MIEKIPQVKAFKFFVTKDQIVLVSPQNTVADVIRKKPQRPSPALTNAANGPKRKLLVRKEPPVVGLDGGVALAGAFF